MAGLLYGVLFETMTSLFQEFRGHAQVHLSGPDMDVAEIDRQEGEQLLHVGALPIPRDESMDGKGVPQIMYPRLIARPIATADACLFAEYSVVVMERIGFDATAVTRREKRSFTGNRRVSSGVVQERLM
jgi:hypothetical protein